MTTLGTFTAFGISLRVVRKRQNQVGIRAGPIIILDVCVISERPEGSNGNLKIFSSVNVDRFRKY